MNSSRNYTKDRIMKFQIGQVEIMLSTVDLINLNIRGMVTIPIGRYEVIIASELDKMDDDRPFYVSIEVNRKEESHAEESTK